MIENQLQTYVLPLPHMDSSSAMGTKQIDPYRTYSALG